MALTSLSAYLQWAQITSTDAARDSSLAAIIAECCEEVERFCYPTKFATGTYTDDVIDGPWNAAVITTHLRPVRAVHALYVNYDANGDATAFDTTADLKTAFRDYRLKLDIHPEKWSRWGQIEVLNRAFWAARKARPFERLSFDVRDVPGCVMVNYDYGYTSVPETVAKAVHLMTSMIYQRRKTGAPVASASINGASYSTAAPFTATAAIQTPEVLQALRGFYNQIAF